MPVYGARWDALRRSTARSHHAGVIEGVHRAYIAGGLTPPRDIAWEAGPVELAQTWAKRRASAGSNVRAQIVDGVRRKAEHAIDRAIALPVRMALAGAAGLSRVPEFCASVDEAVQRIGARALPALRTRLLELLARRRARLSFASGSFSFYSAPWLGAMQYLHEACGLARHTEALQGLWQIADHACWMVPHEQVCWLMERPSAIRVDANGRLHAADGPALTFASGSHVYAWKGVLIPAALIEQRERIDVHAVDAATDPQIRRCMIEIMTPQRFVEQGGAYRAAADETGILWRQRWRWEAWAAVEVINGTPEADGTFKHYFLQVPATVRTPREGVAWTYGLSERHYRPSVRT